MKIKSLRDLFEIKLRYAYDCEQKLVKKGLPTMIESERAGCPRAACSVENFAGCAGIRSRRICSARLICAPRGFPRVRTTAVPGRRQARPGA